MTASIKASNNYYVAVTEAATDLTMDTVSTLRSAIDVFPSMDHRISPIVKEALGATEGLILVSGAIDMYHAFSKPRQVSDLREEALRLGQCTKAVLKTTSGALLLPDALRKLSLFFTAAKAGQAAFTVLRQCANGCFILSHVITMASRLIQLDKQLGEMVAIRMKIHKGEASDEQIERLSSVEKETLMNFLQFSYSALGVVVSALCMILGYSISLGSLVLANFVADLVWIAMDIQAFIAAVRNGDAEQMKKLLSMLFALTILVVIALHFTPVGFIAITASLTLAYLIAQHYLFKYKQAHLS